MKCDVANKLLSPTSCLSHRSSTIPVTVTISSVPVVIVEMVVAAVVVAVVVVVVVVAVVVGVVVVVVARKGTPFIHEMVRISAIS